jgi:threonylcarbamoyladenosine tRNA methylthiotransferase MtaB
LRQGLIDAGHYCDAAPGETADLCIVNTCTVTQEGDAKSRQVIRRMARQNPAARLIVMGCYATRAPEQLARLPGVVEVVTDKRELPDLLGRMGVVDIPDGISRFGDRHRAYIKVQDGCLLRCSYCIIPYVRPQMTSRAPAAILAEARRLVDHGYRELVLTGIHLGHYGVDGNRQRPKDQWNRLSTLLEQLVALPGRFRIRLSSIEATEVTRELLDVMAAHAERICPHLHICLQSGSDRILRRMKRRGGSQRLIDRCGLARERLHKPALTTDVIVGFPGETDEDFARTCDVVRQVGFSKLHIFPFSARRGTPAAEMPEQVDKAVQAARTRHLAGVEAELRARYFKQLLGETLEVLVEAASGDEAAPLIGTSCRYAPVKLAAGTLGRLVTARAARVGHDGCVHAVN